MPIHDLRFKIYCFLLAAFYCCLPFTSVTSRSQYNQPLFDYLKIAGHQIETSHKLTLKLAVDKSFKFLGKTNYQPTFQGKGFNVSLAAFARADTFIMIHAETHTDGSGGLDYSNLTPDNFGGLRSTSKEVCGEFTERDIADEHDLAFLKNHDFNPAPAIYLKQYFATSADGTSEVVITYGKRIKNCQSSVISSKFKTRLSRESHAAVKILSSKSRTNS